MIYLSVDEFHQFQCAADRCLNTCCVGWKIVMNRETYEKMVEGEEVLQIPASDWLEDKGNEISVRLDHGRCPMLTEDNLCRVVARLGPEYLCPTCMFYPRCACSYGDVQELYLALSCPEVLRSLMEKEQIEFDIGEDEISGQEYPHTELYVFESAVRTSLVEFLYTMRQISLPVRLFAAFTILEEGVRMDREGNHNADLLRLCIDAYAQPEVLCAMEEKLRGVVDERSRYHFLGQILNIAGKYKEYERFHRLVQQAVEYFGREYTEDYEQQLKTFRETVCREYGKFYTNYWVYRLFCDLISVPEFEKSREKFLYIGVEFALFQTIALVSFIKGNLAREEYMYIISCLSRLMEHSDSFYQSLTSSIVDNDLVSVAGILLLIIA